MNKEAWDRLCQLEEDHKAIGGSFLIGSGPRRQREPNPLSLLHQELVREVDAGNVAAVLGLMRAQLTADRGMMRCALVTLKPVRDLPEYQLAYNELADKLREGSTHGII
jgi:hypothetical protein